MFHLCDTFDILSLGSKLISGNGSCQVQFAQM
jgi:hypothetical protein